MVEELTELYTKEWDRFVKRISYRVGGMANAEDVVQTAFLRAMEYAKSYEDGKDVDKWFNTILNNATRDFKRQERLGGMTTEEAGPEMETGLVQEELLLQVDREIQNVKKEAERYVLRGYLIYGWKPREIAFYSELKPNHIRVIVHRFKQHLKEKFGENVCSGS